MNQKQLIYNRKATFTYEIQRTIEAGIELQGFEVKALKAGKASLDGSYITVRQGEIFLVHATISAYQANNHPADFVPDRERKLLISKKEISELDSIVGTKNSGLTLIPLSVYMKNNRIKIEIALARGKKKFDKRESIKKREAGRDIARDLK
ncbi:MAG: SsrA-binding protein SmpB [bacterium]